jgi:hypothetical protein
MGNHATTNFFGDELATATFLQSGMEGFSGASASGFTAVNSNGSTAFAYNTDHMAVEVGKTYNITYNLTLTSGTLPTLNIQQSIGGSSSGLFSGSTSAGSNTHTFTCTNTNTGGSVVAQFVNYDTDVSYAISNFSMKEVGISSSGFETAVNEPVVPQVPLMRYNQKMKFKSYSSGTTGQYVDVDIDSFSLGDFTISFWYNTDNPDGTFIGRSTNSTIRFSSGTNTFRIGQNNYYISASAEIINGRFLTATREGTSFKLYVDGILDSTTTVVTDAWTFGTDARIGQSAWSNFDGTIHECSVFNTALTQTQIQELFNDGVALDATTHSKADDYLLAYYRNDGVTTWTDRSDIQAIGFNGVSNHSIQNSNSIGNALGDNYTGDLSISVWFKRTEIGISGGLVDIGYDAFDLGIFTLFINSSNELTFSLVDNAWNLKENFTDTDWNHVLAVYKAGNESGTKLYLNGSSVGTATGTFPSTSDMDVNGKSTFVGLYRSSGQSFTGIIGQTAIWTKELSSIEVSEIYNLGRRDTDLTTSYSTNLLAYYLLNPTHSNPDSTGADKILDRSGNNHHASQVNGVNFLGTNNGTVQGSPDSITIREGLNSNRDGLGFYFTNPSSNVLRLNGVDEYVQIQDNKVFSFGDSNGDLPFSIEAWIKPENATNFTIISKGKYNVDGEYLLQLDADKKLYFALYDGNAYEGALYNTALGDYEGSWLHICATYNGVGGTSANAGIKLYVDSEQKSVSLLGGNTYVAMHNDSGEVEIGKYDNIYANGIIDELRIYNKELSLTEIQKNYKHQKGKHKND